MVEICRDKLVKCMCENFATIQEYIPDVDVLRFSSFSGFEVQEYSSVPSGQYLYSL